MISIDNFKKEAKRWLKQLRAGDAEARARLLRVYPNVSDKPVLREVQQALARELGYDNWLALKTASERAPEVQGSHEELVARFLKFACWDHTVSSRSDHRMYDRAAQRLLAQHPEIARHNLYTAIVCGEVDEVARLLRERPAAASEPGGPRGWPPLLYLCFTRFSNQQSIDNAVTIARILLDHGADPNTYYMAGNSRYSALVGVAGEGEQNSPRQPQAPELFQLLLEGGAKPFDLQVLYNTHFSGDVLWWLELVYEHTMKSELKQAWEDPNWEMFEMGVYGTAAQLLLHAAVFKNDLRLAEWLLSHGASPNPRPPSHQMYKPKYSPYDFAVFNGRSEMADLLVRYGAKREIYNRERSGDSAAPNAVEFEGEDAFIASCLRLDLNGALFQLRKHPEYRASPEAMYAAATIDRADVVEFLLDLGFSIEITNETNKRIIHEAASSNALQVAKLLIERGAEVDPIETTWDTTPIGWAAHADHIEMVEFLSAYTRDIWTLSFWGYVDRLREVLQLDPKLAKLVDNEGNTPLWWLPDDEAKAIEIVKLFISHGADPARKNNGGRTAADWATTRGMLEVAALLRS
jgi:ankyrin repeat protein